MYILQKVLFFIYVKWLRFSVNFDSQSHLIIQAVEITEWGKDENVQSQES